MTLNSDNVVNDLVKKFNLIPIEFLDAKGYPMATAYGFNIQHKTRGCLLCKSVEDKRWRVCESSETKFINGVLTTTYTFGKLLDEYVIFDCLVHHISFIKYQIDRDTQTAKLQRVANRICEIDKDFV
jgi:hypothetical protein